MKRHALFGLISASLLALPALGCASAKGAHDAGANPDDAAEGDAAPPDAGADAAQVDKAAVCASSFGSELTNAFGRADGTILVDWLLFRFPDQSF